MLSALNGYVDRYLILIPKGIKVCLFDGRNEIINRPQWKHDKLPKSIRTYDRLSRGFNTSLTVIGVTL